MRSPCLPAGRRTHQHGETIEPILAVRAYRDRPALTKLLRDEVGKHANFKQGAAKPSRFGEEMTIMGGPLESHLREVKLEGLFQELRERVGEAKATEKIIQLSESNGTKEKVMKAKTYEEKVLASTRYAYGQKGRLNEDLYL